MKSGILAEPILVGRARELEELQVSLNAIIRGKGTTVFVTGEAGSGKTRLTNEFLNLARNNGVTVLSGWCLSNAAVPFFPFMEAFDSYVSSNEGNSKPLGAQQLGAKTWLMGPDNAQTMTTQALKDQTFAAVTNELLFISTSNPVILFIDDLHWADSASLALLHYIARSIASERILILVTFRSEEVNVNVEGHGHQLVETLHLMGREDLFKEIRLPSLSQADVGGIAESMLGGKTHASLVEKLATESHGNPLFVVESLRMLDEQKGLIKENGQWHLSIEKFSIPAKVKDVILRRIDSLKPGQRRVLDAASVVGEKFDPKLVAAVVSQDNLDVLESLNAIVQCTLLVYCEGDYYRFDHAKSREMLYDQLPSLLKKEYHSRIAEKIESDSQSLKELQVSDLAYHYAQAGNKEKSVKYALAAGKDALARFSNKEALNHFTFVLQTISEDPKYGNERATALEGLGEAFLANSMFKEAAKTFEQLSSTETGVAKLRALRRAMDATFFQGEFAHLLDLTKKAEKYADVDRLESARILMNRARAVMFLGNHKAGREDFEAALRVFEEEYSLPDVARTLLGLGGVYGEGGLEKGLARALRAVALYDELGDDRGLMDAYHRAGQSFGYLMLTEEALDMHAKTIRIGEKIGDYNRLAEASASSGWALEITGDLAGALSRSLKALEFCGKTDSDWIRGITYSNLVRQYTKLGDLYHAEEYFEKLKKLPLEVLSSFAFVRFGLSKAVFFAVKKRWDEVNQYFEESLSSLKAGFDPPTEVATRLNYAWALNKQKRTEEAKKQVEEAQKTIEKLGKYFEHAIIQATLMVPKKVELGKEFTMQIDIINVSRKPSVLVGVERLIPLGFKVNTMPDYYSLQHDSIKIKEKKLDPFQVELIKLTVQATRSGVYSFEPKVVYVDDLGHTKTLPIEPISVTVQPAASTTKLDSAVEIASSKLEFNSKAAQKAFDYLVSAFMEDYRRLRLPQERSGWRTLMDIVKHGKVSKYSMYGFSGNRGQAVSKLESLGLVETRVFVGERGRGGKILKLRVDYEKETVRRQIEMRNK